MNEVGMITLKLHNPNKSDLCGFVNILASNGYEVRFRNASGMNMMCDIVSDEKKVRVTDNCVDDKKE